MELVITKHAMDRALERLFNTKGEYSDEQYEFIKNTLIELIKPFNAYLVDGAKYIAQIDGYPKHRARIKVENGKHILVTVVPIF